MLYHQKFYNSSKVCFFVYEQSGCGFKWLQRDSDPQPVWLNGWVFVYELSGWGFKNPLHSLKTSDFLPVSRK